MQASHCCRSYSRFLARVWACALWFPAGFLRVLHAGDRMRLVLLRRYLHVHGAIKSRGDAAGRVKLPTRCRCREAVARASRNSTRERMTEQRRAECPHRLGELDAICSTLIRAWQGQKARHKSLPPSQARPRRHESASRLGHSPTWVRRRRPTNAPWLSTPGLCPDRTPTAGLGKEALLEYLGGP